MCMRWEEELHEATLCVRWEGELQAASLERSGRQPWTGHTRSVGQHTGHSLKNTAPCIGRTIKQTQGEFVGRLLSQAGHHKVTVLKLNPLMKKGTTNYHRLPSRYEGLISPWRGTKKGTKISKSPP